ncbi:MAG: hypothetical protein H0V17_27320 [Deltaproteobacteria bacterium]|nr:hypothetical protein [Deltaproteobacteria bacterium]
MLARALLIVAVLGSHAIASPQADDKEVPAAKKKAAEKAPKKPKKAPKKKTPPKKPTEPEIEIEMEPEAKAPEPYSPPIPPPMDEPEPVAIKAKAKPATFKKIYLRGGIAHVAPLSQSRELELADIDGPASLAVQNGPIAGSGSTVSSATIPAITIGYRLTPRISLETVLGVPFTVKFKATGTLRDMSIAPTALGIPTGVPPIGEELGEAKAAPPMITAVYELTRGKVRPYVGAGVAVLFAYGGKLTNPVLTEVSQPEMKISPAPGLVLQTGLEAKIAGRVYARLDVKFIALMLARARVEHVEVRAPALPLFDTVEVGTAKMSVWVNPLIVQLGVGTDF